MEAYGLTGYIIALSAVAAAAILGRRYACNLYRFLTVRAKLRETIDKDTLRALGIDVD